MIHLDLAHLAAAAEARPDDDDDDRCHADGPHGACCRDVGHYDGAFPVHLHVTYDRDHYDDWPTGWASLPARVARVLEPTFGADAGRTDSAEFRGGFNAALALVRQTLRGDS